ncbi:MAG: DUF4080 domain-containing protein, partial [Clostridiaceae bacterium]|nr:DUF4080 domain-containing protein [Clostridiaceae bacterium]
MKKVALVALNSSFSHTNLALRYIREKLKVQNIKDLEIVFIEKTINESWLSLLDALIKEEADVYTFSCYIWNRELVETLSLNTKKILPQTKIVWGGPDVSAQADILLAENPQVDAIICGEGDSVSVDLILSYLFPEMTKYQPNSYDPESRLYPDTEEITWKFPYTDNELQTLNERILYYEGSRGCAYKCTYCLSGSTYRTRFKDIDEVLAELKHIMSFNPRQLKFIDRTFNSDPDRAYLIWQFLIEQTKELETRTNFHFEIGAELLTDKQLDLLATAPTGLFQFEIGAQTTNPEVLKLIKRPFKADKYKKVVSQLRSFENIHIHLDLIAGLPGESLESQIKSANFLLDLEPNMLQLGFLKVLPATPIKYECDHRGVIYQQFPPYEVLQSDGISAQELMYLRKVEQVLNTYYNSGQYYYLINFLIAMLEKPFSIFLELTNYIDKQYGRRKISQTERYQLLANFVKKEFKQQVNSNNLKLLTSELSQFGKQFLDKPDLFETVAIDLLKVDYFKQGMKSFPNWFNNFQNSKDKELKQRQKAIQKSLKEANHRQRMRFEIFSFS